MTQPFGACDDPDDPDEVREGENWRLEVVNLAGDAQVGRITVQPGWRWSVTRRGCGARCWPRASAAGCTRSPPSDRELTGDVGKVRVDVLLDQLVALAVEHNGEPRVEGALPSNLKTRSP